MWFHSARMVVIIETYHTRDDGSDNKVESSVVKKWQENVSTKV
jgi:hypothetical protein